jgi:hypothetical protein
MMAKSIASFDNYMLCDTLDLEGVAVECGVAVQAVDAAVGDVGELLLGADDGVVAAQLAVRHLVDGYLGRLHVISDVLQFSATYCSN